MESIKADGDIGTDQSASHFSRGRQESLHQKSGTEFVDNVQLQCKSIMERMRVIKQSVDGIAEDKDSLDSSDQNPDVNDITLESTNDKRAAEMFSEMDPQEQGRKIKERVERIVQLVQSTAQKAEFASALPVALKKPFKQATLDTKKVLCQNTSPVVEEKTLKCNDQNAELAATDAEAWTEHSVEHSDEDHDAMKKLPGSSETDRVSTKEGKELVGKTSSERKALVIESNSDCYSLKKRSSEEKKLQIQEPIAGSLTEKQIANEKLAKRHSVAETAALILAHSNHANLKTIFSDDNSVRGFVKTINRFTVQSKKVEDSYRQIAKNVVQEVFARIGCHENFVRRARWANEPSNGPRNPANISTTYSVIDPREKMKTSTQNSSELATPEESKTDGIASTAQAHKTFDTKTLETGAEPLICRTAQSKATSLVTSSKVRSRRRISLKRSQKNWARLKKRKKSFPAIKTQDKNNTLKKKLTWQISTDESTDCREEPVKVGSSVAKDAYQQVEECYQTVDEDKLAHLKEFIALGETKTKDGEDVVLVNPSKIPSKREFTGRKEYNEVMECLLLYVQKFTEEQVKTETFVITVHAVQQRRSRLRSLKWATEFYKFLKQRYQNRMTRCVFYKPSFKLRALMILSHPFFSNCMREKIFIVKSRRDFAKAQGLPEGAAVL